MIGICGQSQSIYIRAGLGGAICTAPHLVYQTTSNSTSDSTYENITNIKRGGLGNGVPIMVAAGYYFGDNFGIELGVDYFAGFNVKTVDNYSAGNNETTKEHGSILSLVPAFVMRINGDKLKPYARIGIMIGVMNTINYNSTSSGSFGDYVIAAKDYGGVAIGAQAAVGAELPLTKLLSLFGEVNMNSISYAPTKGKYTKFTNYGVDQLPDMTTSAKTWVYEKSIDSQDVTSKNDPNKLTMVNFSFANVGIVVGVKINLGK